MIGALFQERDTALTHTHQQINQLLKTLQQQVFETENFQLLGHISSLSEDEVSKLSLKHGNTICYESADELLRLKSEL